MNNKRRKNILVTGGAGFIGANFIHYHMENYYNRITVLDVLNYAGNYSSIAMYEKNPHFCFIEGDICNEQLVRDIFSKYDIDTVVHFAAESHVDRSIYGPDPFITTNIVGTHTLLKIALEYWSDTPKGMKERRFHHVSTDEVFGSLSINGPSFTESSSYDPRSPYSASKASSDHLVRSYHYTYGMNITISNCSNNYGPYQFPEKLIPLTMINILHGKPVPVYGDGSNVRDWIYVEDHVRAIDTVLSKGKIGNTYNIGGNCELKNIDVVEKICSLIDSLDWKESDLKESFPDTPIANGGRSRDLINFVKDRAGHDFRYAINTNKISKELDYAPSFEFDSGLKKTISWYLDNSSWWKPLLDHTYGEWIKKQYG